MITQAQLDTIYTRLYDEAIKMTYKGFPKFYTEYFDVRSDKSKKVELTSVSGLGIFEEFDEGAPVPQEDIVELWQKTLLHKNFGKGLKVTFQAVSDDEKNILSKIDEASLMGPGAARKEDTDAADIFNNHTTTLQPDGVALVDNLHPQNKTSSTKYDNELTGADSALDHDALEDMEILQADNMRDAKGNIVAPPPGQKILVPTALKGTAMRIVSDRADLRPGTMENDINIYAGKYDVISNPYLTGSTTAWWLVIPSFRMLRFYMRESLGFTSYIDRKARAYIFEGVERYSLGVTPDGWRCIWGSVGS